MDKKKGLSFRGGRVAAFGAAAVLGATGHAPAGAQTTDTAQARASVDSEIIVTATRREARLLDVPISIQAVTGEELARIGAVNFSDYARGIAGVSFLDNGPGRNQIFIRGVSAGAEVDTGTEATVGLYIDETPVGEGSSQPDIRLYDIDRVEVLRGPQGTLFGSGSLGGTLRVLTNQPRFDQIAGYLQLTGSVTDHGGANGAANGWINIPLSDKVAVRAVAYGIRNAGFIDDLGGEKNINEEKTYGGRLAVRFQPVEDLNVTLTGMYQDTRIGALDQATDTFPDLIQDRSADTPYRDRIATANLRIDLDLGFGTLTSSSSYFVRRRRFSNDIDHFLGLLNFVGAIPFSLGDSRLSYPSTSKVQEIRLASNGDGPFRWVVGGFYLDRDDKVGQTINPLGVPPQARTGDNIYYEDDRFGAKQLAGFTELSYDLTDRLTATAGARVSRTRRSEVRVTDGPFLGGFSRVSGRFSETSTTPKFNLSYKPADSALLYVQAAKGFRIGGNNAGLPPCGIGCTIDVGPAFDSDSLWNYEVGAKFSVLDRALTVTAAAFRIDWKNIQLNVERGDGFNGFLNAGTARIEGAELEIDARIGDHWRFGGQATYTDATLRSVAPGVPATPGQRLPQVARWNAAAHLEYGRPVGGDGYAYIRGDVQYVGPRVNSISAAPLPIDDYALFNLKLGLNSGSYEFSLFGKNLLDKQAQLGRTRLDGVLRGVPVSLDRISVNVPRTIGLSVARSF